MATTTSVVTTTATSAAAGSLNTCPTLGPSTLHHSCPPPAPYTASTALSLGYMISPTDMQPPRRAEPHTNSSRLPSSSSSHSPPAFTRLTPFTVALVTCPLPTAVPSPATLSPPPMRRWTRTTNQTRPARCPARLASRMPPHKCPPSSPTTAGPHSACRHMFDWTKTIGRQRERRADNHYHLHIYVAGLT